MKRGLALLAAALAVGGAARGAEIRVVARETAVLAFPGATGAFALDASTVEVATRDGDVVFLGRRAGRTLVTVILPSTVETVSVTVEPPPPFQTDRMATAARDGASWDLRYDSGSRRFTSALNARMVAGERTWTLRLEGLHDQPREGTPALWALPFAALEIESPGQSIVLLDQFVKGSPLVLDQVLIRGAHLRQGPIELHAGIASTSRFNDIFVPSSGDRIVSGSIELPVGGVRWVPGLAWLPDSAGEARGVATLGLVRGAPGDRLQYRGELGWGGRAGADFDVELNDPRRQAALAVAYRPAGFAALRSVGRPPGSYFDGSWTEWLGERSTLSASVSDSRLDANGFKSQASSGRIDSRMQATENWSFNASAGGGTYRAMQAESLRRGTLAAGAAYDTSGFGIAALYRYQVTSAADRGGHGGRLSLRGQGGGWRGTAYVDAQQQAPTVDLILQDRSDLARTLAELGLSAANPEDLIRLLRDNAALFAGAGASIGELRLSPLRLQGGLDISWRQALRRPEFGLRVLADDVKAVASRRTSFVATAYAKWPVGRDTEIGLAYSRWSMRGFVAQADQQGSIQAWIRTTFSDIPLPGFASAAITGSVLRDAPDEGRGRNAPLADVEIILDRGRRTRTDRDGNFAFELPGGGAHRVDAILPRDAPAYFTSPSSRTAKPGEELRFTLTFAAARLAGTVRSNTGVPIEGATLRLQGAVDFTATTDSSGSYRFAGPPGTARVSVVPESMPPGYELRDLEPIEVVLSASAPATADFAVRAFGLRGAPVVAAAISAMPSIPAAVPQRSTAPAGAQVALVTVVRADAAKPAPSASAVSTVSAAAGKRTLEGTVTGTRGVSTRVSIVENGLETQTDGDGRFVLRDVPAGPITVVARSDRGSARHRMRMPAGPIRIAGIELALP